MKKFFSLALVVMLTAVLMLGCKPAEPNEAPVQPTEVEEPVLPSEETEEVEEVEETTTEEAAETLTEIETEEPAAE
jgi:hypothetical protein